VSNREPGRANVLGSASQTTGSVSEGLIGRDDALGFINDFLGRIRSRGEPLLILGEPGIGKTALLDAAADAAAAAGTRVLRAAGAEFEAEIPFSGLHQVLCPLIGEFTRLSAAHREALAVALGFRSGSTPDQLVVASAVLSLARSVSEDQPVLILVDDLQWLDRASARTLVFLARRLSDTRSGFLAASRPDRECLFEHAGLTEYELEPLDGSSADRLVRSRCPMLARPVHRRVLAQARGNPLALLELPLAMTGPQRCSLQALPAVLPLTRRLNSLFASQVEKLPGPTRQLLLLCALDATGNLGVLRTSGLPDCLDALGPAERARLVRVDAGSCRLEFRHPLIRAAVVELSTVEERRRTHRSLADLLADQPDRQALHLAEGAIVADERVAGLIEATAYRILGRGDAAGAVSLLLRASELSPHGRDRSRRLAKAAYVGAGVTGELSNATELLGDARQADPHAGSSLVAAAAAAVVLLAGDGEVDAAHRLLVAAVEAEISEPAADDVELEEALFTLLFVCFFGSRAELWPPFYRALAQLPPSASGALRLSAATFPDPARTAFAGLAELDRQVAGLGDERNPTELLWIARAAFWVDRVSECRSALWRIVESGRTGGAVASALSALVHLGYEAFSTGRWDEAIELVTEGFSGCDAHGYQLLQWSGRYTAAAVAALRGDAEVSRRITDEMSRWAVPHGAHLVETFACHARALAALGARDYEAAYAQLASITPAGTLASHVPTALWTAMDMVEAALHCGRHADAVAHVHACREANIGALSSRLALNVAGATALVRLDDSAFMLFEQALAIPQADRWPFDLARVQLLYGERLRRARLITESRCQLGDALETFERLGARPWAVRAANELRATGQSKPRGATHDSDSLTAQEREIAMLAAEGLSNKEIGQHLFLSHRTVGAHLYRIFPKLSITSRAALRDALASIPHGPDALPGGSEEERKSSDRRQLAVASSS
jgi:DNA-binding CsgD family transcriptional regulator